MKLSESVTVIPVMHGNIVFSRAVREICSKTNPDKILLSLPEDAEESLGSITELLPEIHVTALKYPEDDHIFFMTADPCDPMIEGVRQALQRRIPYTCAGGIIEKEPKTLPHMPEPQSAERLGSDVLSSLCIRCMANYQPDENEEETSQRIAHRIIHQSQDSESLVCIIHFRYYLSLIKYLKQEQSINYSPSETKTPMISEYRADPDTLYFILGDLPFSTGLYEQERYSPFSDMIRPEETVSRLFRDTRESMYNSKDDSAHLSPVRLKNGLKFLRNLTLMESVFIPSLFDIVTAAKGIGGNSYALRVLKQAKYYPFLPLNSTKPALSAGIDRVSLSDEGRTFPATNLFKDKEFIWKRLSIKSDPSLEKKKEYRYKWNPFGMCSHIPEDNRIENFNSHVRNRAIETMNEAHVKTEKFQSSVKDGIDIRETLRNWHTGSIYIKEIPQSRGKVDTVVVIFDEDHDDLYPSQTTWYAEHKDESTLSFYATDPFSDLIGPGVARSRYGGVSMIFPPVHIPNIFSLDYPEPIRKKSHILTAGSILFSREMSVAYVANKKPPVFLKQFASRHKRKLVWIPISRFSSETLRKLRNFHVLNGHEVRSWASRYIGY